MATMGVQTPASICCYWRCVQLLLGTHGVVALSSRTQSMPLCAKLFFIALRFTLFCCVTAEDFRSPFCYSTYRRLASVFLLSNTYAHRYTARSTLLYATVVGIINLKIVAFGRHARRSRVATLKWSALAGKVTAAGGGFLYQGKHSVYI